MEEDLLYRSPPDKLEDEDVEILGFPHPRDIDTSMINLKDPNDPFSQLQFKNLVWVGKISVFLEIWKKDPVSGEATKHGTRVVSCTPILLFNYNAC